VSRPAEEPRTPRCRGCQAPLRWARAASTGNRMPFDLLPSESGTWSILSDGTAVKARPGYGGPLYTPHWASCPQAGLFRGAAS
jgi:hypothetical protein